MSNLAQRVIVAAIGIPIVGWIVIFRPIGLLALLVMLSIITVHEFYGLAKAKGYLAQTATGFVATGLIVLSFAQFRLATILHRNSAFFTALEPIVIILLLTLVVVLAIELFRGIPNPLNNISLTIAGALYVGLGLGSFFGIREFFLLRAGAAAAHDAAITGIASTLEGANASMTIDPGLFAMVVLASIWICDSGAYFGGRAMGKHFLFPRVSPHKTWEGAIWGGIFAVMTWLVARAVVPGLAGLSLTDAIALGLIVGIFGQIGDLAESLLKRDAGVKDSSTLIPGHGGMLDRLDSILFVSPLIYLYLQLSSL